MEPYDGEPTPPEEPSEPAQAEQAFQPIPPIPPIPPVPPFGATPPEPPEQPIAETSDAAERRPRIEIDLIQGAASIRGGAPQVLLSSPGVRAEDHIVTDMDGTLRFHRLPDGSELSVPDGAHVLIRQVYGDLSVEDLDGYVTAQHIRGDLTLSGLAVGDFSHVEGDLTASEGGSLRARVTGGDVRIGDYEDAPLLGHIGGDLVAHDLPGLDVRQAVGGDVELERCGTVTLIGAIGGDLRADHTNVALRASSVGGDVELSFAEGVTLAAVGGDLRIVQEAGGAIEVSSVGGDADLRRTRGVVRLGTIGGDLNVDEATGGLVAGRVGGDAELDTTLTPGAEYKVRAGGDIDLRVRGEVNARFVAQTHGGEISTRLPLTVERGRRRHLVGAIGRGDATVTLESGGDITITATDRFEEEHDMNDDFGTTGTTNQEDPQTGPRSWETTVGGQRFRVQWDRQPGKANFQFKGPFTEDNDPDAMNSGPAHDFNFEWERGKGPQFSGEYQEQFNELREKAERAARKAAEQAQMYAERAAKRARDTDWEAVGREVRSAVERAMSELENAFGSMRNTWENRPSSGAPSGGASSQRPSGAQRVRIEVDDDPDAAKASASGAPFAASSDDVEARRRGILEQLRGGTISLDEAERQLNDLR